MHVRVVELMVAGVRRPREECLADPGTIGTLSIGDIPIGTAEKRKRTGITPCRRAPSCAAAARPGRWP
ncbi:hypothetical protein, partial [Pseudomonas aeruginosa]|uniref:hypothetical protein n=1 Tax=Pseudomonas aeruginosa TaxID=287 RepID=UPI001CA4F924